MSRREKTPLGHLGGRGKRVGTDFTISRGPNGEIPSPGNDMRITMIAKTWKKQRGMKRDITATFVYVPDTNTLVCD